MACQLGNMLNYMFIHIIFSDKVPQTEGLKQKFIVFVLEV